MRSGREIVLFVVSFLAILMLRSVDACADVGKVALLKADKYDELLGVYSDIYDAITSDQEYEVEDLIVSKEKVSLEHEGQMAYFDVIGILKEGGYVNLTPVAEYSGFNTRVISCVNGNIRSKSKGNSELEIQYKGIEKKIYIAVGREYVADNPLQESLKGNIVFKPSKKNVLKNQFQVTREIQ